MFDKTKICLVQNTLGPNVYGGLFTQDTNTDVVAYIDYAIGNAKKEDQRLKVAILVEPVVVNSSLYNWIEDNHSLFDLVLTHNKALSQKNEKFKYYPVWPRIWIPESDRKIYDKTKKVSAIFSNRNQTIGHKTRHVIAKQFSNLIDLYGKGYNPIETKTEGISDYMYHVVVENEQRGYASEKVNDSFCCGSIPIYWGDNTSNVLDFYNKDGILMFETMEELENILLNIASERHYNSKKEAIEENFNKAANLSLDKIYWDYGIENFLRQRGL